MANNWYCDSVAYAAVAQFANTTLYTIGQIIRQLASPTVGNERCFRCTTGGTTTTEQTWALTANSTTTQGTAVFTECTGQQTYQGTSWAAPHARLANALASGWAAAGDTIYVGSTHAETQASNIQLNPPGTFASPNKILCVTRPSASIPPASTDLTTGATISTTGANALQITTGNTEVAYYYGITFQSGSGASAASIDIGQSQNAGGMIFEKCGFTLNNTSASSTIFPGGESTSQNGFQFIMRNCTMTFGAAGQTVNPGTCGILWDGGSVAGTAPTILFTVSGTAPALIDIRNVDLSLLAGSSSILTLTGIGTTAACKYNFVNCKLNASLANVVTGSVATPLPGLGDVDLIVSDASTTAREEHYRYSGTVKADTANYLTTGATDGTTHKSWNMTSNAKASYLYPLYAPDIFQWVPTTGSYTLTMYISNISGHSYTDQEFGFDCEYLGTSSVPLGTLTTTMSNANSAGAALASDTQPWTGQGGLTKQKVTLTITINNPGFVRVTPKLAKASSTVWIDPLVAGL